MEGSPVHGPCIGSGTIAKSSESRLPNEISIPHPRVLNHLSDVRVQEYLGCLLSEFSGEKASVFSGAAVLPLSQ